MMESKSTDMIIAENHLSLLKNLLENGRITEQKKLEMKVFIQSMMETIKIDIARDNGAMDELKARMIEYEKETSYRIRKDIEEQFINPAFEKELVTQDRKTNEFYKYKVRDFGLWTPQEISHSSVEPKREKVLVNKGGGAGDLMKN